MELSSDRLILLGTKGGPRLGTGSSWPTSMVLEISGRPYIIDAGLGVTRQFVEAGYALDDVHTVVISHHHSDHNLELGALLHTTWTSSRFRPLFVFGPPGLNQVIEGFLHSNAYDIEIRMNDEGQSDLRAMIRASEYVEGHVFRDDLVEVSSLAVVHPPVTHCYALKFRSKDKTVVLSSDTAYFPPLADFARGADILVHEVMHRSGVERMCKRLEKVKPNLLEHMIAGHTYGDDVGRIASVADVGHLVLNHYTPGDDPDLSYEDFARLVRTTWSGQLTAGGDLTTINF